MRYAYFCCLLSIFCFTAATSDTLTLHTPATLPTIIVKDIKKAAFKKDVLTWEAVEKESPRTLVDVLKNVNGIYITQSGGATSASSLFLRGGNPNHTLVLSDGMRSMDPTVVNGSFNAGVWIASDFDVITVKKGPLSSLHGSDAVAGVISTEMAKGEDRQTTISTLHGSFDTHTMNVNTRGSHHRFHYNVRVSGFKTQGFTVTPTYLRTSPRQSLNDPSQIGNLHGRLDADINDDASITYMSHLQTHRDDHNRSTINPFWLGRTQHTQNVLTLNYHKNIVSGLSYQQKLLGGFLKTKRHDANVFAPFDLSNRHQGERKQLTWQHELAYKIYKLLGEIEYQTESLKSYSILQWRDLDLAAKSYTRSILLSPSLVKPLPYNQELALKGSLRFDHHSQFKGVKTFMTGIEYELPTRTRLSLHYGTAYKAPTLYQLNINTPFFVGNPNLKPEQSHGIQYGLSQRLTHHLKAEIYYFQNHIKELIVPVNMGNLWIYQNTNRAKISGIESAIIYEVMSWKLKLAHTNMYTRNAETCMGLKRRPKNIWHMGVMYTTKSIDVGIGLYYKSKGLDTDPVTFKMVTGKSNKSIDAHLTYHATPNVDLFMKVENILDYRRQQDPLGYLRPGLGVYAGVKVTF